ncbi:cytochrome d ubiquinol oxidase subunit II [Falsiroseomonas bella]|uniref:Cytochrome d ubiquinol oxidase subunit II n=1 Tax=Falsiroseomonas bella TaxID=2184016 RepID=A0A317FN84_9PROT|nr:cytochrome d ubiquinol oxidase subunit II [Falsiroseomonas bella]PWS38928.1 cytochrome d ubiquinol oxidase subunit II [Falsiroseomonas bella]
MEQLDLPLIWALLLATAVFLYIAMDGFDLGVGILFPRLARGEQRDTAVNSIAPVWDGNETWLILGGGGLLAVFPLAYAIVMPALYMPLIVMLLALIFRGVAFEMRFRQETETGKRAWDNGFWLGSTVAAFCQGVVLGAFVQGIAVEGRGYAGGWWDWLTPFSVLTGVALVAGYGLLGATWLVWKTEGALQEVARRQARWLTLVTLGFMAAVSLIMPFLEPTFAQRWFRAPALFIAWIVPVLVVVLTVILFRALAAPPIPGKRTSLLWRDAIPFGCTLGLFLLGYAGLGISLWPMIVPGALTIWQAAAPPATQAFLLVGAAVLVPVILVYTGFVYWLFRGKVRPGEGYHH